MTVSDGLEVVAGGGGSNRPQIEAPRTVRRNRSFQFEVSWSNDGLNDAIAPLLQIGGTVPFGLTPSDDGLGLRYETIGTSDPEKGPAGILRPGQSETVTFFSFSDNQPGDYTVFVDRLFQEQDALFDFNAIRDELRPVELTDGEFQPLFEQLITQVGLTNGDYLEMLARNATLLPPELGPNNDVDNLLALELRKAEAAIGTSISGELFARSFSIDIAGVVVDALNTTTNEDFSTFTLNDGTFIFEDLTPGLYEFSIPDVLLTPDTQLPLDLQSGEAFTGLTLELEPGLVIFGEVTSAATGTAITDAFVNLFRDIDNDGIEDYIDNEQVDSEGGYSLSGLEAGTYTVVLEAPGFGRTFQTNLMVTENTELNLQAAPQALITGTVTTNGQPVNDAFIFADIQGGLPFSQFPGETDSNGDFIITEVTAGTYDIAVINGEQVNLIENVVISEGQQLDLGTIDFTGVGSLSSLATNEGALGSPPAGDGGTDFGITASGPSATFDLALEAQLAAAEAYAQTVIIPALTARFGLAVGGLWSNFINSSSTNPTPRRTFSDGSAIVEDSAVAVGFRNSPITQALFTDVRDEAEQSIRDLFADGSLDCDALDTTIPVQMLISQGLINPRTNWNNPFDIPGNIAGGISGGDDPSFPDSREISGDVVIRKTGNNTVSVEYKLNLRVQETIDFIPGGLGAGIEQIFTRPLRFLEANDRAFDVQFVVDFDAEPVTDHLTIPGLDCDEPDEPDDPDDDDDINRPTSVDPNDILGPDGFGEAQWITASETLDYTIRFENDPIFATAPAQVVRITQTLDPDLDPRTFRVGDFGFGDVVVDVPDNRAFFTDRLDLTESLGIFVDFVASIDVATSEAFWEFTSIAPETGEVPEDALTGFLPPNLTSPEGEGFVKYSVRPKTTAVTGDVIDAEARIVFDINEPIDTPPIFNTLDAVAPTSAVDPLPAESVTEEFLVSWTGSDDTDGSGLAPFDIFVSIDGAPFEIWLDDTTLTEALYPGEPGRSYDFYSVAQDNAGNVEAIPSVPDATTTVSGGDNEDPIAIADSLTTDEDMSATVDVLDNDSDPNVGDVILLDSFTQPTNGTVVRDEQGTVGDFSDDQLTYTPAQDFFGADSFTYTISDGNGGEATATVDVTVNPINDDPIAVDEMVSTDEDMALTLDVLTNASDPDIGDIIRLDSFTQPTNGTVVRDENGTVGDFSDDQLIYTPAQDFFGADSFTYTIGDGNGGTATATVDVTVNPINDGPVAGDDVFSTDQNLSVTLDVLANDSDPIEGDEIDLATFTQGTNGTVNRDDQGTPTDLSDDQLIYTPNPDFFGVDSFTYTIDDGNGGTDMATVELTVFNVLEGDAGDNDITGSPEPDRINGSSGRDTIDGGGGDDLIVGGSGGDILIGGPGSDRFVYESSRDMGDIIVDFEVGELGQDVIDVSQLLSGPDFGSADKFDAYVNLFASGADTAVQINFLGDSREAFRTLVTLQDVDPTTITADHFIV